MITVWPNSSTARRSRPSTSPADLESRLPVGSSANTTAGREISARAIATRCCWPPDSSAGRCVSRSPRPTASTSVSNQPASTFVPASISGSVMFSRAVSTGIRLYAWKTKPSLSRRSVVSFLSSRLASSWPATTTEPEVGRSSPASRCISVDLPEPGRPHDRRELARRERQRDSPQRVHRGLALAVLPVQLRGRDDRGRGSRSHGLSMVRLPPAEQGEDRPTARCGQPHQRC